MFEGKKEENQISKKRTVEWKTGLRNGLECEWVLEYWGLDENFCHQEKIEVKIKGTEAEIDTE